jgi:methylase of polypeptide subunit release factors
MLSDPVNELTFVARLGAVTALRADRRRNAGESVLIESGEVEEKQVDAAGRVRRCDIRLNTKGGRKLASGEMKRPEVPEGRDPRNETLRDDARRKALARGLPYYFTCNMAEVVLYAVAARRGEHDREEVSFKLAPIKRSQEVDAYRNQIAQNWIEFLDDLERRLTAVTQARPSVTTADVVRVRDAIYAVAEEAIDRVAKRVENDAALADRVRQEAATTFQFPAALKPAYRSQFYDELKQILRFGVFVFAQKLVLYRVLEEAGPRRRVPFRLDHLEVPHTSSDPRVIYAVLDAAISQAIDRSEDYETAFLPKPLWELVFLRPEGAAEVAECRVGEVWHNLLSAVESVSWVSISQNLVGLLYEIIVDPQFRHHLGQFYTREDVVDLLVGFAIRESIDVVMDPASGGGSFLRSSYTRKRALGLDHESALASVWGCEVTAFAAELSTITLATSDTSQPAAYPRVILTDFFDIRPNVLTPLEIPGEGRVRIPAQVDAIVGNPPYISYRRITNQAKVLNALAHRPPEIQLPKFSGKTDAYVWFIVHSTQFLREGGRLAFVVSSAMMFADYGVPLIRFIARHYRIRAVIDSMVERWFPDADTNTVLLLLERCGNAEERRENEMRFVRLRRPLAQFLADPADEGRRETVEQFIDDVLVAAHGGEDPRILVSVVRQGEEAGLSFSATTSDADDGDEDAEL